MDALAPFRIPVASLKAEQLRYNWELGPDFFKLFAGIARQPVLYNVFLRLHAANLINTYRKSGLTQSIWRQQQSLQSAFTTRFPLAHYCW